MFRNTSALYVTAAVLGMIGVIPGMPHFSFLCLALGAAALGWYGKKAADAEGDDRREGRSRGAGAVARGFAGTT